MNKVVSKNNGEHYKWGANCDGWHLLKSEDLSIIQEVVPPGQFEVKHYHQKAKQFFFVLSGTATIELNDSQKEIKTHEGIFIEAGVPHQLFNNGSEKLEFLVISSPKSHGDRVEL